MQQEIKSRAFRRVLLFLGTCIGPIAYWLLYATLSTARDTESVVVGLVGIQLIGLTLGGLFSIILLISFLVDKPSATWWYSGLLLAFITFPISSMLISIVTNWDPIEWAVYTHQGLAAGYLAGLVTNFVIAFAVGAALRALVFRP
jgi:hypothetical protein